MKSNNLNIIDLIHNIYIYKLENNSLDRPSELVMHKVLFFVYALFYKKYSIELFIPNFESWTYGPVEIRYRKIHNNCSIDCKSFFNICNLNNEQTIFLNSIIEKLLKTNIWDLVDWSHSTLAYQNGLSNPNKAINNKDIQKIKFNQKENRQYCVSNILGKQKPNNEFYTPSAPIINLIKKLNIPKNKVIWCPFDLGDSEFVKQLTNYGYKVIYSHIKNGQDFYKYEPNEHWDVIISNPPFSKKRLLIERCETFKKDFCLLYGATIFSQSMGDTLNRCKFLFIQNNIKFTTINDQNKSFQCCWVMNKNFKYLKD